MTARMPRHDRKNARTELQMTESTPARADGLDLDRVLVYVESSLDLAHDLARVGRNGIGRLDDVAIATGHARGRLDGGYLRL